MRQVFAVLVAMGLAAVTVAAQSGNAGLIITSGAGPVRNRDLIVLKHQS